MTLYYRQIHSPVGKLKLIANAQALVAVLWERERPDRVRLGALKREPRHPILCEAERQLAEYFAGKRTRFDLPLALQGTPFQVKVWRALTKIPFAETKSYRAIASAVGAPKAARAVGAATGKNPLSIIVPCHRVVGRDGSLTGFAGGLETKAKLLALEARAAKRRTAARAFDSQPAERRARATD
ncbi:MAG TPA: methylated-DNA--[protein]-cysteine S-methyltransferase [Candidatus Acidoferrales bacterium]|nr:methylated-DNA--[protein]-cysteine S-methyltransferase [Candidatus Acidoferrales bacterium]